MNDLMRPALYGAKHQIIPLIKEKKISNKTYDFVGPICETTDKFLSTNKFQKLNKNKRCRKKTKAKRSNLVFQ